MENPPEGVSIAPVEVPAGRKEVALQIGAQPGTKEQVVTLRIASRFAGFNRWDPMILRISYGESGFLPRRSWPTRIWLLYYGVVRSAVG